MNALTVVSHMLKLGLIMVKRVPQTLRVKVPGQELPSSSKASLRSMDLSQSASPAACCTSAAVSHS